MKELTREFSRIIRVRLRESGYYDKSDQKLDELIDKIAIEQAEAVRSRMDISLTHNQHPNTEVLIMLNKINVDNLSGYGPDDFSINESLEFMGLDDEAKDEIRSDRGGDLVNSLDSADHFEKHETATKTKLAEILLGTHGRVFTVEFEKANGELRKLRGYLIKGEPLMGRSHVMDLDKAGMRLHENYISSFVDHRTIKSIIYGGTKYVLK